MLRLALVFATRHRDSEMLPLVVCATTQASMVLDVGLGLVLSLVLFRHDSPMSTYVCVFMSDSHERQEHQMSSGNGSGRATEAASRDSGR
jgi:hypothetical protein